MLSLNKVNPLNIFKNFNKHSRKRSYYSLKPWKDFLKVVAGPSGRGEAFAVTLERELHRP